MPDLVEDRKKVDTQQIRMVDSQGSMQLVVDMEASWVVVAACAVVG